MERDDNFTGIVSPAGRNRKAVARDVDESLEHAVAFEPRALNPPLDTANSGDAAVA